MAVTTEVEPINRYNGNNVTTVFAYTWKIFVESELVVEPILGVTQILNTHYTLSGVGADGGGNVTFVTAPPAGTGNVVFARDLPFTQEKVFPEGTKFPTSQITEAFDRDIMIAQQLLALFGRAYVIPLGETPTAALTNVPALATRASKFFAWDSSGQIVAAAGTSANLTPVSTFINTLLDDADAATARATLDAMQAIPLDSQFRVAGSSDSTKKIADEVDGLTTGTTRTQFHSDEDVMLAADWGITNATFTATVASSALTIALKTKKGTDPTATDPVMIKFPSNETTTCNYTVLSITGALSVTVSSGSTLGTESGIAHRLYIGIADDGGTSRLFIYNPLTIGPAYNLQGVEDNNVYSSTAEGGVGGADSAHVLYSTNAFTSKFVRLLGYVESSQTVAGTWNTAVTKSHLLKPWDKRTGDVVQKQSGVTAAFTTGTTLSVFDDTIPQNTEGVEFITATITPRSAINLLEFTHQGSYSSTSATSTAFIVALFKDSDANALHASLIIRYQAADTLARDFGVFIRQALSVSAATYKIRTGLSVAGTTGTNGSAGARKLGGVLTNELHIAEIMV